MKGYFVMETINWKQLAACTGMDTNLFYVSRGEILQPEVIAACKECLVKKECLEWAVKYEMRGYWAGTSGKEREKIRSRTGVHFVSFTDKLAAAY